VFNISIGLFSVWLITRAVKGFKGVTRKILEWRPIRYLGAISYGIYLYHILSWWLSIRPSWLCWIVVVHRERSFRPPWLLG